jgi:hypothetical protein
MIKKCNVGRDFVASHILERASLCQKQSMSGSCQPRELMDLDVGKTCYGGRISCSG